MLGAPCRLCGSPEVSESLVLSMCWPTNGQTEVASHCTLNVPNVSQYALSQFPTPHLHRLRHGSILGQLSNKSRENKIFVLKDAPHDQPRLSYSLPA